MKNLRFRPDVLFILAGALFPLLLVVGAQKGPGQEKAGGAASAKPAQQWTAESHDKTNFPLVGKHRILTCRECHVDNVFEGTPMDCEVCHWQRRQDDRYGLRLGMRCADCHTPQSWKKVDPAKWSHETVTGLRLEGIHRTLDCEACHGSGGFAPRPTDCYSCHQSDYQGTREPNHAEANFPTDCRTCHNQRGWSGASFSGHGGFELRGKHATAACSDCHKNGVYAGTPTDCASCHLADYNGTTDPDHRAAGFPLDCTECHGSSANGWQGADSGHTAFVLSGRHASAACSDCHKNGVYAGTPTDCASCHLTDYNGTTDPDHRAAGFPLNCTECHGSSANSWTGASFVHDFPIQSGRHAGLACSECHRTSDFRSFNCLECHTHDKTDTDNDHRGVSGYAYSSQACYACHPRGSR